MNRETESPEPVGASTSLSIPPADSDILWGDRPTKEQSEPMTELVIAAHEFAVSQIREGGVSLCD